MLQISLPPLEKETLEFGFLHHKKAYFRKKCHIMLLNAEGWDSKELARLYKARKRSIYEWIHAYEKDGFLSFYIRKGRGLRATMNQLTEEQLSIVQTAVQENPQSLRTVAASLSEKFSIALTKSMVKSYVKKKLKYTFHRLRKWLKPKQDKVKYDTLAAELKVLLQLEADNYLKFYFADQSGFSLDPCIPYGWQPCGKYNAIVPQSAKRRNVFGLMRLNNEFEGYDMTEPMNSEAIIAFIDDFLKKVTQKTVTALDNATIHHSKIFQEKRIEWEKKDLYIWFFPTYSPHLNRIETLWRKIKYEWLKPQDYLNQETLDNALDNIFNNIGSKFTIQFS